MYIGMRQTQQTSNNIANKCSNRNTVTKTTDIMISKIMQALSHYSHNVLMPYTYWLKHQTPLALKSTNFTHGLRLNVWCNYQNTYSLYPSSPSASYSLELVTVFCEAERNFPCHWMKFKFLNVSYIPARLLRVYYLLSSQYDTGNRK